MTQRLFAAAGAAVMAGALLVPAAALKAEVIEQVLVKVNGEIVSKTEFEDRQVNALRARPEFANVSPNSLELQKAISELTPDLILEVVDELLLIQRGRELEFALGDQQFKQILEDIKKSNNITDEAQFQAELKQAGMTEADLRRDIERRMMIEQVQRQEVTSKISATEEESRAYFETHRAEFTTPSEIMLREILIEVPSTDRGVNVAQDDVARAKAEEVRQRLLKGEPFPRLAAEVSNSPSKANGGLIGPIHMDELAPQLQELLSKLKVGDLAEIVRTTRGYQILKLESRTDVKSRTFEEARNDIGRRVIESKGRAALQKYLDQLRGQATIIWRNAELERAYNLALAKRRQAAGLAEKPAA
jgi:parvulin-like peptidyl-prolyl isomerase